MNSSCLRRQSPFPPEVAAAAAAGTGPEMDFLLLEAPALPLRSTYFSASVPWTRCLVTSNTFRFLLLVFRQISMCLAIRSSAKFRPHTAQRAIPSGTGPLSMDAADADATEATDAFLDPVPELAIPVPDLPVDARDLAELGWEPRGDGAGAGAVFFGTAAAAGGVDFSEAVVGVRPGTGFSFKLLTFCGGAVLPFVALTPLGVLTLPTLGSFRARGVPVEWAKSTSTEMVSGNFSSSSRFSLSSKVELAPAWDLLRTSPFPFSCWCCLASRAFVLAEIGGTRVLLFIPFVVAGFDGG